MSISIFDLFSIGLGPSSSHTVGPMKAACAFIHHLNDDKKLSSVHRIQSELFGSLAYTGKGHGTDKAVLLGIEGNLPDAIDPAIVNPRTEEIINNRSICLAGKRAVPFDYDQDVIFNYKDLLPFHSNGLRFKAFDHSQQLILEQVFYSIGGGFIVTEAEAERAHDLTTATDLPYPFTSAAELFSQCKKNNLAIHDLMLANEAHLLSVKNAKQASLQDIYQKILFIASTMSQCIKKGCETAGILPGELHVKRRAHYLREKLLEKGMPSSYEYTDSMNFLNLYAIAVNEENAAGGRVVTAPTNGAAGVVPAVLQFYKNFYPHVTDIEVAHFLLTAGAIAVLYKKGASISGAEVGCQGEVGVACSMAAGALAAALGGSLAQIENAAEIAMEHHLGMTCDPVAGLVQIPCIERNAMGAVKAVNAARLALLGDGEHKISLDKVIATMKQTGKDMMSIYKETSLGGLAANLPEC